MLLCQVHRSRPERFANRLVVNFLRNFGNFGGPMAADEDQGGPPNVGDVLYLFFPAKPEAGMH